LFIVPNANPSLIPPNALLVRVGNTRGTQLLLLPKANPSLIPPKY
jgi:hypothetical protein